MGSVFPPWRLTCVSGRLHMIGSGQTSLTECFLLGLIPLLQLLFPVVSPKGLFSVHSCSHYICCHWDLSKRNMVSPSTTLGFIYLWQL